MTKKIQAILDTYRADAALITHLPDVRWACGFTGSNGLLIVRRDVVHFLSDGRYTAQAQHEVRNAVIHTPGYQLHTYAAEEKLLGAAQRVLFQADQVTVAQFEQWRNYWPSVEWIAGENVLTKEVAVKTDAEIGRMRRAQQITDQVFDHIIGTIRQGRTEKEIAAEIVYEHLRRGADKMSFDPIVASGPRGALPHARPTEKKLENGELVVLDFGCFFEGYASDMTRTVAVGEPGAEARRVYQVVREAQANALEHAEAGIATQTLDGYARTVIDEAGYGSFFTHSLGHGIGLQTHEWPRVSSHTDEAMPEGTAITIEPGIYLPGKFGVRIEDLVLLRAGGCENLTASGKALIVL